MGQWPAGLYRAVSGAGLSRNKRIIRVASSVFLLAAVVLFVSAAAVAMTGTSPRKPLPTGTIFKVPIAGLARVTPVAATPTAAETATPPATPAGTATDAPTSAPTDAPADTPTAEPATPTPEPTPAPDASPVERLQIPSIKVDAPVSLKGVDANGVMENPNSWDDVAYYDFSGKPGFGPGNNAVFGGHVDFYPHRTAVFWDLRKLQPGDEVRVLLQDGTSYSYLVTEMEVYNASDPPLDAILGDTADESVTLITCDGTFSDGEYNNRLVVRAVRQAAQPQASNQSGG